MPEENRPPHTIHKFIGTSLFTGYSPYVPGTAGSALCFIILWFMPAINALYLGVIALVIFFAGVLSAGVLESAWGIDSGKINIDEFAGMTVTLIGLPKTLVIWLAAFILFRALDIFKPPPIRLAEFLPGGWGIMLDDVIAGIYANLLCWVLVWIL